MAGGKAGKDSGKTKQKAVSRYVGFLILSSCKLYIKKLIINGNVDFCFISI